jgi:putative lipoic acid-binding regulatory protein
LGLPTGRVPRVRETLNQKRPSAENGKRAGRLAYEHADTRATPPSGAAAALGNAGEVDPRVLAAVDRAHELPGYFPVVLIARSDAGFRQLLADNLAQLQGAAPYSLDWRTSTGGAYTSYQIRLWVEDAASALRRRQSLAAIDGVILAL